MKKKQLKKELLVRLTPEEKSELADRLTDKIELKDRLEDAKKVAVKNYSAKVEECVAEINELSSKIRGGSELRMVDCEIVYDDPQSGLKTTYRLDTNEAISTNRMDADDLQGDLFEDQPTAPEEDENGVTHINLNDGITQVEAGKRYEIEGKIYRVKESVDTICDGCAFDTDDCGLCGSIGCEAGIFVAEAEAESDADADQETETEDEPETESEQAEAEAEPEAKESDNEDQPPYAARKRGRKPAKKAEEE